MIELSLLDQSSVRHGSSFEDSLSETILLAQHAEKLGFKRFWVSEHHGTVNYACCAPEVLAAAIGARTSKIRIGTGGIMLPHYSPFKVAEVASLLATLFSNRVDIGVGRASGASKETAIALSINGKLRFDDFKSQVDSLVKKLSKRSSSPCVIPQPNISPEVWILGAGEESAALAAKHGLAFNAALFINPDLDFKIFDYYKSKFVSSGANSKPRFCLTVSVICAESKAKADYLLEIQNAFRSKLVGQNRDVNISKAFANNKFNTGNAFAEKKFKPCNIAGTKREVGAHLRDVAKSFGANELMLVTAAHSLNDKLSSCELLAQELKLRNT